MVLWLAAHYTQTLELLQPNSEFWKLRCLHNQPYVAVPSYQPHLVSHITFRVNFANSISNTCSPANSSDIKLGDLVANFPFFSEARGVGIPADIGDDPMAQQYQSPKVARCSSGIMDLYLPTYIRGDAIPTKRKEERKRGPKLQILPQWMPPHIIHTTSSESHPQASATSK